MEIEGKREVAQAVSTLSSGHKNQPLNRYVIVEPQLVQPRKVPAGVIDTILVRL